MEETAVDYNEAMKTETGITLIELVVTIAIAAILVGAAAPMWKDFIQSHRAATAANTLVGALQLARSEAVKRGLRVSVCSTADPTAAAPVCSGSGDWHTGWIVFTDDTGAAGTKDGTDELIRIWNALSPGTTLTAVNESATAAPNVQFLSTGFSVGSRTFLLMPPDCADRNVRTISVSPQGRTDVGSGSCS